MQAGLSKQAALDFSFLMAMPIILGATALTIKDVATNQVIMPSLSVCIIGFVSSFVVSYGAVLSLRSFINKYELSWFAVYLVPLALLCSFL
jgi:undecaprenyl-diphosphatase